jgi:3-hydroxyisobutyrate dehydrogenase-like beta-hydroxyacid dehydrogenase
MRIGFVGLGRMGAPIARNFAAAGHEVLAWNRSPVAAPEGVRRVGSVEEALGGEMLFSLLADDRAVREVLLDGGALARLPRGGAHVNMATISLELGERLHAEHARLGSRYVSAPVFGRPAVAAARKLFVVAGGDQAAIAAAQPLFDATAQRTFNVGEKPAHANLVKLCGNLLVAMAVEGLGETLNLARRSGFEPKLLADILGSSIFAVPVYQGYGRLIAEGAYEPALFSVALALKDVELGLAAGARTGARLPQAELVRAHLRIALERGLGDQDWSVIARVLE